MRAFVLCVVAFISWRSAEAVNVSIAFDWDRRWHNSEVNVYCDSDHVDSLKKVHTVRFWSVNSTVSVSFEASRNCTSESTAFNTVQDTTGGRISVLMDSRTTLNWGRPQNNQSSYYMCSLTLCSSAEEYNSSNSRYLTIVVYNKSPIMTEPAEASLKVFENANVSLKFTCQGYTGYPGGTLKLEKNDNGTIQTYFNVLNTGDGNISASATITQQYTRVNKPAFTCYTINEASGQILTQESSTFRLFVEYKPDDNTFTSDNSLAPITKLAPGQYQMLAVLPLKVQVSCEAEGNPTPVITLDQVEGLTEYVNVSNQTTAVINVDSNVTLVRLKLQCNSTYQSTIAPQDKFYLTSYLTIMAETPQSSTSVTNPVTTSSRSTDRLTVSVPLLSALLLMIVAKVSLRVNLF